MQRLLPHSFRSPAIASCAASLASDITAKRSVSEFLSCRYEVRTAATLSRLADSIADRADELEEVEEDVREIGEIGAQSFAIRDTVLGQMAALRELCDEAETVTSSEYWPFPTYGDLLFSVN